MVKRVSVEEFYLGYLRFLASKGEALDESIQKKYKDFPKVFKTKKFKQNAQKLAGLHESYGKEFSTKNDFFAFIRILSFNTEKMNLKPLKKSVPEYFRMS